MELYLMRHGLAVGASSWQGKSDRDRPLSEEGVREMRRASKGLAAARIRFDRIFSSPYTRAIQTARIVAEAQAAEAQAADARAGIRTGGADVEEMESLGAGLVSEELLAHLGRGNLTGPVLLVGHEPDMGLLAASLIGLAPGYSLPFKPGSVMRIDLGPWPSSSPSGSLVWLLTARLAGALSLHV